MNLLHKILLGVEIYALASASLVALSVSIATVRAMIEKVKPVFNYPVDVPRTEAQVAKEGYFHRAIVALDIFLNVVFMFGEQDETMSTHAWRASLNGKLWGKLMNWWLNGFQANHGPQAASGDLERALARVEVLRKILNV